MNTALWNAIIAFNFDDPPTEYGFSTRLARENFWTKDFTGKAILEYRKFMYLAAVSDSMVSPSEIVDAVWHQHLIFTQCYQDFCAVLGKQVQHVPSTRQREDQDKFRQAKERTAALYAEVFGEAPENIWNYSNMYESLHLEKAPFKLRTFIIAGILGMLILSLPFFFAVQPLLRRIGNPDFMIAFITLVVLVFIALEVFNQNRLRLITRQFSKNSFVYFLQPYELVYLKTRQVPAVVNGVINELIDTNCLRVTETRTIELCRQGATQSIEQLQVANTIHEQGPSPYAFLVQQLASKPLFANIANCMDAFKKYFNKSRKFASLFYINFCVLAVLLLLGASRLVLGAMREKPIAQIAMLVFALTVCMAIWLYRLTNIVCTNTLPNLYKKEILSTVEIRANWQWQYFVYGTAMLNTALLPLVNSGNDSGGGGDSGGGSCGSSCGSSCGGCGGD